MQPTSILANNHANKIGLKAAHADKIVEALEKYGKPATAWRISILSGLDYHSVSRRTSELRDKGIIQEVNKSNDTQSGLSAIEYKVTKQSFSTWLNGTTSLTQGKMFE